MKLFLRLGNAGLFLVDEEEDLQCLWEAGKAKKNKVYHRVGNVVSKPGTCSWHGQTCSFLTAKYDKKFFKKLVCVNTYTDFFPCRTIPVILATDKTLKPASSVSRANGFPTIDNNKSFPVFR